MYIVYWVANFRQYNTCFTWPYLDSKVLVLLTCRLLWRRHLAG
jgi:hypothetical protein